MSLFLDYEDERCPFGIHAIARMSGRVGVKVGEWFGPTTIAGVLKFVFFIYIRLSTLCKMIGTSGVERSMLKVNGERVFSTPIN